MFTAFIIPSDLQQKTTGTIIVYENIQKGNKLARIS